MFYLWRLLESVTIHGELYLHHMNFKVYLDNCCFNRPFDDQNQIRIRIETEAKLYIQREIEKGALKLVWSYILDYENSANPYEIRQTSISKWKQKASFFVTEDKDILKEANRLTNYEIKAKDALHIACAKYVNSDYFITTDDKILNKSDQIDGLTLLNPVDMLDEIEE